MDRLTVRIDGEVREDHSRDTREWRNGGRKCMGRLAAYEDTGLLPEICANYKKFEDESIANGVPFSRIIELMNADAEGRVVILPCKVGDTVYRIFCGEVIESTIDMIYVNRFTNPQIWVELGCRFMCSQTERWDLVAGKEIFNDRESAESRIRAGEVEGGELQ